MKNTSIANLKTDVNVQCCTDKGLVRQNNEDYCGYYIPEDNNIKESLGCLFAVADGVGSCQAGEVASAEAINVLLQEYYFGDYTEKCPERFKEAYDFTSLHIYDLSSANGSCNKMMCTLTALLLRDSKFYITHVGDSKAFLLRDGNLIQLTKDHSVVGKLVRMGFITKEQARTHPNKHVILRSLGERPILPADFYSGNIQTGDVFFLCTDGIFNHFTEEEIQEFLLQKRYQNEGIDTLVRIGNERGGEDNMTVMSIDADW
ncbi:MAG: protein phosphatase 2C domain-containing protein [Clostridia bacterium]|nr:protein phosphatase 2C domain-containing protein [Clostridia bacterium]MDR3645716.1 protein phosphatase 2C domain-containing protein [Clostridia bacterium]